MVYLVGNEAGPRLPQQNSEGQSRAVCRGGYAHRQRPRSRCGPKQCPGDTSNPWMRRAADIHRAQFYETKQG